MTHGEDGLGGGHTVVGDEDLADDSVPPAGFDVVFDLGGGGFAAGEGGFVEGGGLKGGGAGGFGDIFVEEGALDLAEDVLFGGSLE